MPSPAITPDAVRLTLRAIRSGRPLKDSPLLVSAALQAAMRAARLTDSPAARATFLSRWLEQVVSEQIALARGNGGTPNGALLSPDSIPSSLSSEFQDGSPDGEAWALLHVYFFSGTSENQRQITARLPLGFNTVRRRLDRGYQLLADVLTEREREASAAVARGRSVPQPSTRFIGREAELGAIRQLMAAHRLVVLTGPGGVGKSRLAIRLARDLAADYPDDAWFVEIAALTDGRQVAQALMSTFGLREASGSSHTDTLAGFLADKRLLLVIDNCEHLAAACSALIVSLLERCPYLQVLATSRVQLQVHGAAHWSVPAMTLPVDVATATVSMLIHFDAPRLFSTRAAVAGPGFQLTDMNAAQVGGICARLDGLPLAIELAAARVPEMSLDQLETRLADRFALLKDGRHATRRSHETLQAMMDWSYDLLSEPEQWLLQRLAVFRGGWTLAAAEAVCSGDGVEAESIGELLAKLDSKSLVQVADGELGRRFGMLETVREYGESRLAEAAQRDEVRNRHLDHFVRLAELLYATRNAAGNESWLEGMEAEHQNFREAFRWAEGSEDAERGLRLCAAIWTFWYQRSSYIEGCATIQRVLQLAGDSDASVAQASARRGLGVLLNASGSFTEARQQFLVSKAIYERLQDEVGLASVQNDLGLAEEYLGALDDACGHYRQALELFRKIGDDRGQIGSLQNLGIVATNQGDYNLSRSYLLASLEMAKRIGHQRAIAVGSRSLGIIAYFEGDYAAASRYYEQDLVIQRAIKDRMSIAYAELNLGMCAERTGDYASARDSYSRSLETFREQSVKAGMASSLNALAVISSRLGDHTAARGHFAEAIAVAKAMGSNHYYSMAVHCSASADLRAGVLDDVLPRLRESMAIYIDLKNRRRIVDLLETFAVLASHCDELARTARLLGAAQAQRLELRAPATISDRLDFDPALEKARKDLGDTAFDEQLAAGGRMTLEAAVAYAMGEDAAPDP